MFLPPVTCDASVQGVDIVKCAKPCLYIQNAGMNQLGLFEPIRNSPDCRAVPDREKSSLDSIVEDLRRHPRECCQNVLCCKQWTFHCLSLSNDLIVSKLESGVKGKKCVLKTRGAKGTTSKLDGGQSHNRGLRSDAFLNIAGSLFHRGYVSRGLVGTLSHV